MSIMYKSFPWSLYHIVGVTGLPPVPPQQQAQSTLPFFPFLVVPHTESMVCPINYNAVPSVDPSGADLPHNGTYRKLHLVINSNYM